MVLCTNSSEIDEAKDIAATELADKKYNQVVLAIPKAPVRVFNLLREHQALTYLKNNEASLYAEGGELHQEWQVWDQDKFTQLTDTFGDLFHQRSKCLDIFGKARNKRY